MAGSERLHTQALSVAFELLEHLTTKPTAMLVAVLWHDITMPVTDVRRETFLFVKCTARTTVSKIKDAYLAREEAPSNIVLRLGSGFPSETTKVVDLDHFRDKVIVFQAHSVDPDNTTSNTMETSMNDSTPNGIPDGTSSNTTYRPTDDTMGSSTSNSMSNDTSNSTSGYTMDSSLNGIPADTQNDTMYSPIYDTMGSSTNDSTSKSMSNITSGYTAGSSTNSSLNGDPNGMSTGTMYSPKNDTMDFSTNNGMLNGTSKSTSGNTTNSSLNGILDGTSSNSTYSPTYNMVGSSTNGGTSKSMSGNTMGSSTNGSTNISTNGSTNGSTNERGNSVSRATPADSFSSSRPQFTHEATPLRQSSVTSRASVEHSFASYPTPSARMSSSSSKSGYAGRPMSPLERTAPVPATPLSASPRGYAAFHGAQRQSPAFHTPTRYAQAPGHPFIRTEPCQYTPYAPASHQQHARAPQAAPRPQELFFGASSFPAQSTQPSRNGPVQTADESANTHPVSFHFHVLYPKGK